MYLNIKSTRQVLELEYKGCQECCHHESHTFLRSKSEKAGERTCDAVCACCVEVGRDVFSALGLKSVQSLAHFMGLDYDQIRRQRSRRSFAKQCLKKRRQRYFDLAQVAADILFVVVIAGAGATN